MAWLRRWHSRIAVLATALLLVVAITGIPLAFRGSLKAPEPESTVEAARVLGLDEAVAAARAHAKSDAGPAEIYVAGDAWGTWCVVLDDEVYTEVYMTADGALLEVLVPERGLTGWLFDLHTGAVLGGVGPWLSAASGLALLWLLGTGLWIEAKKQLARRARATSERATPERAAS